MRQKIETCLLSVYSCGLLYGTLYPGKVDKAFVPTLCPVVHWLDCNQRSVKYTGRNDFRPGLFNILSQSPDAESMDFAYCC